MGMITADEVQRVEAEAEQAARELREAEQRYGRSPGSADAYARHQEALGRADHAAVRLKVLREEWAGQQAVREARAAAGEAAVRELAGVVGELELSRLAAVQAVVEADAAMARALAALASHDGLVREAGRELERRGLRHLEGEETGANLDGSARVGGVKWPLVDGGGVLVRCLAERVAEVSPRHPLARPAAGVYGGLSAAEGRDAVLALVRAERRR